MKARDSLRRRIVAAYLLFAACATILFAVMAAVAVEGIEEHLVDRRLLEVAEWASPRHAGGLSVAMPAGVTFHHGATIPAPLRALADGVHEVTVDGLDLHVYKARDALGPYVVIDHESAYEHIELVVYSLFALAFVGLLGLSVVLGVFIARRVVNPITTLAQAVQAGASPLPTTERNDELGILARAFAASTQELRSYLDRERFFTGDVSHELRTPLTVIIGAAEILVDGCADQPALKAPAERILRAANEAADCVQVLLLLARAPQLIAASQTDIAAAIQADIMRYQPLVTGKALTLRFAGGESFAVRAPVELCRAAIGNLIRNACQYTAAGEVVVRLSERSVIVEDTGPGLPPAVRATLEQGAPAAAGSAGTGIGLTLVRRICEHLGATITLSDRPSGGSRFEMRFPQF